MNGEERTYDAAGVSLTTAGAIVERLRAAVESTGAQSFGAFAALHPPREWIDELLAQSDELQLSELHLKADDPSGKAKALAAILDVDRDGESVEVGETIVRFVRGGPQGRPELFGELFI